MTPPSCCGEITNTDGWRWRPRSSISRLMCGFGFRSERVRPCARRRCARTARSRINDGSANSSSDRSTMTSRVARSAVEIGRRRVPLVVRSSLPATRRMPRCSSNETIRGNLDKYGARLKRMVDHDDVLEALSNVIDPELGLDFVELGLIYGVEIEGGTVNVTFTLTTPACPIGPQGSEQREELVGELPGVDEVVPTMVFTPPWSPEKMSEDAKFALGY